MNRVLLARLASVFGIAALSLSAEAALFDRGNGMIYDDVLNITWLQDMSYVKTSGYSATGFMSWDDAKTWAANLSYGGFSDWRLPSARLIGDENYSPDGSTDYGYNNYRSELGHLYYVDLNNDSGGGLTNTSFIDALSNQSKAFLNMADSPYWLTEAGHASGWIFDASDGLQYATYHEGVNYAPIAVRDGDVAAVPVPAAAWLMGSALLGLTSVRRRRKN